MHPRSLQGWLCQGASHGPSICLPSLITDARSCDVDYICMQLLLQHAAHAVLGTLKDPSKCKKKEGRRYEAGLQESAPRQPGKTGGLNVQQRCSNCCTCFACQRAHMSPGTTAQPPRPGRPCALGTHKNNLVTGGAHYCLAPRPRAPPAEASSLMRHVQAKPSQKPCTSMSRGASSCSAGAGAPLPCPRSPGAPAGAPSRSSAHTLKP